MSSTHTHAPDFDPRPGAPACPACGTTARRTGARFCATCGRGLHERSYLPADTLRASYHQQRHPPAHVAPPTVPRASNRPRRAGAAHGPQGTAATEWARALATYALVPYVGLLFCPGACVCGGVGYWRARRAGRPAGARAAGRYLLLTLLVAGAQVFLWWLLYKVPTWARP